MSNFAALRTRLETAITRTEARLLELKAQLDAVNKIDAATVKKS